MENTNITLGELKTQIATTRNQKTPSAKELREKETPVLTKETTDGYIIVYPSGFGVYKAGSRWTILRIDSISKQAYRFFAGREVVSMDALPWDIALSICGDERIERHYQETAENTISYVSDSFDGDDDYWSNLPSDEDVAQTVCDKLDDSLEQLLACLTERQRQVVQMYYLQHMTQQKIADRLGVDRHSVIEILRAGEKKLKKIYAR